MATDPSTGMMGRLRRAALLREGAGLADGELLEWYVGRGDESAFEALVGRYQGRVYRLACRLTSETEAPDLLQETFLQAYRHLRSFRHESRFGTWLYRIATNMCLMHRRTQALAKPLAAHDAGRRR